MLISWFADELINQIHAKNISQLKVGFACCYIFNSLVSPMRIQYYHCNDSSEYDLYLQYLPLGNDTEEPVEEGKHLYNPKKVSPAGTASCLRWCSGSKQPSLQDSLVRQLQKLFFKALLKVDWHSFRKERYLDIWMRDVKIRRRPERTPLVLPSKDVLEICGSSFSSGLLPPAGKLLGSLFIKISTQFKLYRPAKISKSLKVWVHWKTRSTSKKGRRQNILPMLKRRLTQKRGWLGRSNVAEEVIEGWSAVSSDRWVNQCNAFHAVFIDRTPVFWKFLSSMLLCHFPFLRC